MLNSWYYFVKQLKLQGLSQQEVLGAQIWADGQVTIHGTPFKATSVASKMLIRAGISMVGDLWNKGTSTWRSANELINASTLCFSNGLHLIQQLLSPHLFMLEEH